MTFVPIVTLPAQLTRVRTEISFTVDDPWSGRPRCRFTLDAYAVTLKGTKSVPETLPESRWSGGFYRALRSEAEGASRFLPESLSELWLTSQIPAEALPGLLKQIEPSLKDSDYRPILRSLTMQTGVVLEAICCVGLIIIALLAVVWSEAPLLIAAAVVAAAVVVC